MRGIWPGRSVPFNRTRNRVQSSRKFLYNSVGFIIIVFYSCSSVSQGLNIRNRNNITGDQVSELESTRSNNLPGSKGRDGLLDNLGLKATLVEDDKENNDIAEDKTFFGEDANGNPIVVGTWFQYGSYTLAVAMFGTAFLVVCAVTAIYYVLFVVTEPSQLHRSLRSDWDDSSNYTGSWNIGKMFKTLMLAYDTYEKFDIYNPECQQKFICEIQESSYFDQSFLRRVSHLFINLSYLDKKVPAIKELRRADKTGLDPGKKCSDFYSSCHFSVDEFQNKFESLRR